MWCVNTHAKDVHGGQRTAGQSQFPPTMWVLGWKSVARLVRQHLYLLRHLASPIVSYFILFFLRYSHTK